MSIATELERIKTSTETLKTALTQTKTALEAKDVNVPSDVKFSGIPALIQSIKTGSSVELVVSAPDYEGQTLTATKGEKKSTGVVTEGTARIPVDEEGLWTVSAEDKNSTDITADMTFEGELTQSKTYGVKITESESDPARRVTYIDDAVGMSPVTVSSSTGKATYNNWDKTWIFQKIYPVMLSREGEIVYKLNPDDYSKREDGGTSDVGSISFDGNAMVCVEKFYTKFSMDDQDEVIEICDKPKEGFEAIGFKRADGTEADKVFLPMFMGSFDSSNRLRSISGQSIKYSTSFNDFRSAAQRNGSTYDIETWAMNQMIQAVYYILMKNCNPKTAIGAGRNYSGAKTGVGNALGAISCDPSSKAVKFMHIEDFTSAYSGGMYRWEAGILSQSSKIYVKMTPPYSGTATSGYTQVSDYVQGGSYVSRMKCSNSFGRYPIAYSGSDSTYEAAYWYSDTSSSIYVSLRCSYCGVAGRYLDYAAAYSADYFGGALSFLPPA